MKVRMQERESVENRQSQMVSFIQLKGYTRFSELANLTGVSELTVRRDLKRLHARGVLRACVRSPGPQLVRVMLVADRWPQRAEPAPTT